MNKEPKIYKFVSNSEAKRIATVNPIGMAVSYMKLQEQNEELREEIKQLQARLQNVEPKRESSTDIPGHGTSDDSDQLRCPDDSREVLRKR